MDLDQYQKLARGTRLYPDNQRLVYPILALCGEAGEVANKVKKLIRNEDITKIIDEFDLDKCEERNDLVIELGDVLWYICAALDDLGYTLDECAQMNLEKLADRKATNSIKDHE